MADQISDSGFKRNIAFKLRVGSVLKGSQNYDGEKLKSVSLDGKEIVRVNLIANVVDKFLQEGEKKYGSLTLDDATGQIRVKVFGDDVEKINDLQQGDTILVIGLLRAWNNEVYITPEIMKKKDPSFLLIRKLEAEIDEPKEIDKGKSAELKERIIEMVKSEETNGGIAIEKIIMELKESPDMINKEIKKILEDGIAYEPRPGKLRYLG